MLQTAVMLVALLVAIPGTALADSSALAQSASLPRPDPAAIGPEAATQVYLDSVLPDKRARSDGYFEGGTG